MDKSKDRPYRPHELSAGRCCLFFHGSGCDEGLMYLDLYHLHNLRSQGISGVAIDNVSIRRRQALNAYPSDARAIMELTPRDPGLAPLFFVRLDSSALGSYRLSEGFVHYMRTHVNRDFLAEASGTMLRRIVEEDANSGELQDSADPRGELLTVK